MRGMMLVVAVAAGAGLASPAAAQQIWQNGRWVVLPHPAPAGVAIDAGRWGPVVDGRWEAATRAPGGWDAYRRPDRGMKLPRYWRDPRFRIPDYLSFGLAEPPLGYHWVRYYDDAVLIDEGGRVWDSMGGIAWGATAIASSDGDVRYATARAGAPYPPPPPRGVIQPVDPNLYYDRGDYRGEYRAGRDVRIAPAPEYDGVPPVQVYTTPGCVQACGNYGYSSYGYDGRYGAGYAGDARTTTYYAGGGSTTTVIIGPPIVTTTVEETVTTSYVRSAARARRVVRHAAPRPRVRVQCCACGCR